MDLKKEENVKVEKPKKEKVKKSFKRKPINQLGCRLNKIIIYTLCNGQTLNIFLLSKIGILNLQGCK